MEKKEPIYVLVSEVYDMSGDNPHIYLYRSDSAARKKLLALINWFDSGCRNEAKGRTPVECVMDGEYCGMNARFCIIRKNGFDGEK